eukprot:CAMPEP_0198324960 /NCGR_PEP_ID=MMETSP1450-20131203/12842_1 /TAXON_ID=753684 ORGANISM="Madagascaria erythrocladiodes, Strain CCMP3234" /NCGR_SAMPLE_ID=MMETSP1450 /ASSEMBLY_ACC=CAM_ASM_001115 /LENGTH=172 /DNA_ID=CAMNT_0044028801 /DNA_START=193 /DNA_END=711 /DNA_ORIENTATION=-
MLGMQVFLPNAILAFQSSATDHDTRKWRHALLNSATIVAVLAGLAPMVAIKIIRGKSHLHTVHAIAGAVTLAGLLAQQACGVLGYFGWMKLPMWLHRFGGLAVGAAGCAAALRGIAYVHQKAWWDVGVVLGAESVAVMGACALSVLLRSNERRENGATEYRAVTASQAELSI